MAGTAVVIPSVASHIKCRLISKPAKMKGGEITTRIDSSPALYVLKVVTAKATNRNRIHSERIPTPKNSSTLKPVLRN
jgi:hypothetical protein